MSKVWQGSKDRQGSKVRQPRKDRQAGKGRALALALRDLNPTRTRMIRWTL